MSRLIEILGPPTKSDDTNIGGGNGNYRAFGSLTVLSFESTDGAGDLTLSGWLVSDANSDWVTDTGISLGSTEAEVLAAYPTATVTNEDQCDNAPYVSAGPVCQGEVRHLV